MAGAATVDKALDVLFHIHDAGAALGLSEIGRALDLPKSSCHRLLTTLLDREVVERDAAGHYRPGLALMSLGLDAQGREPVVRAARPILEAEASALGETVFVVAMRRQRLRVLDKVEGTGFLRAAPGIGDVIPTDVTAAGKLYRAFGRAGDRPADEAGLSERALGEQIDRRGYATNRDAWIDGLSVLGVPIWQRDGVAGRHMVATLALAAASPRFIELGEPKIAERLLAAAERVEGRLGAVPPASPARRSARRKEAGR